MHACILPAPDPDSLPEPDPDSLPACRPAGLPQTHVASQTDSMIDVLYAPVPRNEADVEASKKHTTKIQGFSFHTDAR